MISTLQPHLIILIGTYLAETGCVGTLANLLLTSRTTFDSLQSLLYREIHFRSPRSLRLLYDILPAAETALLFDHNLLHKHVNSTSRDQFLTQIRKVKWEIRNGSSKGVIAGGKRWIDSWISTQPPPDRRALARFGLIKRMIWTVEVAREFLEPFESLWKRAEELKISMNLFPNLVGFSFVGWWQYEPLFSYLTTFLQPKSICIHSTNDQYGNLNLAAVLYCMFYGCRDRQRLQRMNFHNQKYRGVTEKDCLRRFYYDESVRATLEEWTNQLGEAVIRYLQTDPRWRQYMCAEMYGMLQTINDWDEHGMTGTSDESKLDLVYRKIQVVVDAKRGLPTGYPSFRAIQETKPLFKFMPSVKRGQLCDDCGQLLIQEGFIHEIDYVERYSSK